MGGTEQWVWVAPPNCPPAPLGWAPASGWQPDPSWGPPPPGWNFWQPARGNQPTHTSVSARPMAAASSSAAMSAAVPGVVIGSWQEAEHLAAWHMGTLGFADACLTGAGNDRGIDVLAEQAVAQVKYQTSAPVGAPAVQQLRGAAHGRQWAIFYSLSG